MLHVCSDNRTTFEVYCTCIKLVMRPRLSMNVTLSFLPIYPRVWISGGISNPRFVLTPRMTLCTVGSGIIMNLRLHLQVRQPSSSVTYPKGQRFSQELFWQTGNAKIYRAISVKRKFCCQVNSIFPWRLCVRGDRTFWRSSRSRLETALGFFIVFLLFNFSLS